jgi:hypothetical protein
MTSTPITPPSLRGAPGYWAAATTGITVAALAMCGLLAWVIDTRRQEERRESQTSKAG